MKLFKTLANPKHSRHQAPLSPLSVNQPVLFRRAPFVGPFGQLHKAPEDSDAQDSNEWLKIAQSKLMKENKAFHRTEGFPNDTPEMFQKALGLLTLANLKLEN